MTTTAATAADGPGRPTAGLPRWPRVALLTGARRSAADRGGLAVGLGFYLVVSMVIGALWRAAAEAGGGDVVGYGPEALSWYILASEAAMVALPIRLIALIGDDIAGGSIASEMLRPASVVGVRMLSELGQALPRLGACAAAGVALGAITAGGPPDALGLTLAAPSLVLAVVCNLAAQHAVAAAAFWLRDAGSTWFLYHKLVFILGGMLMPLEVLPGWLERVATALPFMAMTYAPARLASGHVEPHLLLVQAGWAAALAAGAAAAFASGERRLQAVGG